jgi:membrane protease subunit (stomatin/prohibitin family)
MSAKGGILAYTSGARAVRVGEYSLLAPAYSGEEGRLLVALIDRIKYDAPTDEAIAWKYPSEQIRLGAQLIVNESQEALFYKGGKALDVFTAGTHTLASGNLPLLSTLVNLPFGGNTPFAAEVWYVNKTANRNLKWGTKGAIQLIDPMYNYPVSVRAFGQWGMRVADTRSFLVQLVGTQTVSQGSDGAYIGADRVDDYFTGEIVQRLSDALGKYFVVKQRSIFQVAAFLNELSAFIQQDIGSEFRRFGIEIVNFNVERVSIPEEEQKRFQEVLGKRMEIDQISQARVGQAYVTSRSFDTLEKAAQNEGGAAGALLSAGLGLGVGVGAGVPLGQQLGKSLDARGQEAEALADPVARLQKLKQLLDGGLITQAEFDAKKQEILGRM